MNKELEKAKEVLSGRFCIRQIDADQAKAKGEKLMSSEDIRYLKEFKIQSHKFSLLIVTSKKGVRFSKDFLQQKINESRTRKLMGIKISDREVYGDTMDTIKENRLFVSHNHEDTCSDLLINYTYFFFDEENQIINEVIKFQDFFGELASVAHLI